MTNTPTVNLTWKQSFLAFIFLILNSTQLLWAKATSNDESTNETCEEIVIQTIDNNLIISGLDIAKIKIRISDSDYNLLQSCEFDCSSSISIPNLNDGDLYRLTFEFFSNSFQYIYQDNRTYLIGSSPINIGICTSSVSFDSQAEVDAFCGCEVVTGVLDIGNRFNGLSDIDDISNLEVIKGVGDYLYVWGTSLTSLSILENIRIGNNLSINFNNQLISIDAFNDLENLNSIFITSNSTLKRINAFKNLKEAGALVIADNMNLTQLNGFGQLESLRDFNFQNNDSFQELNEFSSLKNFSNRFGISNNDLLETTTFSTFSGTVGTVFITDNPSLKSLPPIGHLNVNDFLTIGDNLALEDCCELTSLFDEDLNNGHTSGMVTLSNNGAFCDTKESIIENCSIDETPCDTSICQGDVILETQAEVDAFCGCEVIEGDVYIGDREQGAPGPLSNIEDLSNLAGVKNIKGSLVIFQTMVSSIEPLKELSNIGNSLSILWNPNIKLLDGLENLKNIGNQLTIESNDLLINLDALNQLKETNRISISGKSINSLLGLQNLQSNKLTGLSIINCDELISLEGLENIDSVIGTGLGLNTLTIAANDKLENLNALSNFKFVDEVFTIDQNPLLSNCCSIVHLIDDNPDNGQVLGSINISNNLQFCNSIEEILQYCQSTEPCDTSICQGDVILETQADVDAFCGCEVIEGNLTIGLFSGKSDINSLLALNALKRVNGIISIINTNIKDLTGLNQLTIIETIGVVTNDSLVSLKGLESLRIINETITIINNNNLEEINALSNLTKIGYGC